MRIELVAFTPGGMETGQRLSALLCARGDEAALSGGSGADLTLWTRRAFGTADALVFIGAAGIAVRAVAGLLVSKLTDPAVLVLDEDARFCVPLLSGHVGGANRLARVVADLLGAQAVITTATDVRGVFAVDTWAMERGLAIGGPEHIKDVSAKLLWGGTALLRSDFPIRGELPPGLALAGDGDWDLRITVEAGGGALRLIPRIGVVGIGCRKGIPLRSLEDAFARLLEAGGVDGAAVGAASTVDRKAEEPALVAFCEKRGLPLRIFSPEELCAVAGDFASSAFVRETIGTDNVCERSAVAASGGGLRVRKLAGGGVAMALALADYTVEFGGEA